ncbi:hypothetical protein Peur_002680 [Populus x canadensis]
MALLIYREISLVKGGYYYYCVLERWEQLELEETEGLKMTIGSSLSERSGREKMEESKGPKKVMSACDVEALKKCLEENKGDYVKCQSQIEAFKSSCSLNKHPPSTTSMESQTKTA